MLAGGIGFARLKDALKEKPHKGDKIVLLGGDNYRIGMGGGAVSSVDTGQYGHVIELNAVQRSNPEMQKRVYNAIRALAENDVNPVISIHDHGAGGHLNCLSELVDEAGAKWTSINSPEILPKRQGDYRERIPGTHTLVMAPADIPLLQDIAARERAPMYVIGEIRDGRFTFESFLQGKSH